jgi:hypothetical protein
MMALRMVEHGSYGAIFYGNASPGTTTMTSGCMPLAARVDSPIAGLVDDLKSRGLFNETLILIGSEFGRTPMIQNSGLEKLGCGPITTHRASRCF